MEEEIAQVQELFTVTQEELSETRMRKEEVENELIAYGKDLVSSFLLLQISGLLYCYVNSFIYFESLTNPGELDPNETLTRI